MTPGYGSSVVITKALLKLVSVLAVLVLVLCLCILAKWRKMKCSAVIEKVEPTA